MSDWKEKRQAAAACIRERFAQRPQIGLILGSGLGSLADEIADGTAIPYGEIPHFPVSTVAGHSGQLVLGTLEGKVVAAMQGRAHYYEGYSMQELAFPVWVMRELGAQVLICTNACGGMNRAFSPGDLMIITDHINWMFDNPLIGANDPELGPRFPAMSQAYTRELVKLAERVAAEEGIHVQKGIYVATTGPMYETRATHRLLMLLGADAVGMSTVPEVIAATHASMKTLGISAVTDVAKEDPAEVLTHEEVIAVADAMKPRFLRLMRAIIRAIVVE